jgi:CubicO group peptidase (beta-lactamase class C family)
MTSTHIRRLRFVCAACLLVLPLLAESLPRVQPDSVGVSQERLKRIDTVLAEHIAQKKIAGAVTLLARRGQLAYLKAHGMADLEANRAMQVDTMFRIASMTKPITSLAVMMLYEEGKFLLTDPVYLYLPEFKEMKVLPPEDSASSEPVPAKRPITIRHLLTHTSGLTYHWNKRVGAAYGDAGITHGILADPSTIGEKMKILATLPLVYHPGERFEYGMSIDVLGRLVEVTSGMTLDAFFTKRIFEPLGMPDTHFFPPEAKRPRLAAVYERNGESAIRRLPEGPIPADGA